MPGRKQGLACSHLTPSGTADSAGRLHSYVERAGLSPQDTEAILGGNAPALLGIPAR